VTGFLDTLHVYVSCRYCPPNAPQRPQSVMQQVHRSHGRRTSRCHTLPIPAILHMNPTELCEYKITGKSYKFEHLFQIQEMLLNRRIYYATIVVIYYNKKFSASETTIG